MNVHKKIAAEHGMSLVEVVVAAALCVSTVLGIVGAFVFAVREAHENTSRVQAAYLLEEGIEAVRVTRDIGWATHIASKSAGTQYYLAFDGSTWEATSTATTTGNFTRTVVFDTVYRDAGDNIAPSGSIDANTRKVTVYVSWPRGAGTSTRTLTTYFTNMFAN